MTLFANFGGGARPKWVDGDILYLDLDGVLHPDDVYRRRVGIHLSRELADAGHALFENAELLVELLQPYPNLKIVLSTSWGRVFSYSKTLRYLSAQRDARVVGATYYSEMDKTFFLKRPRGAFKSSKMSAGVSPTAGWRLTTIGTAGAPASLGHVGFSNPRLGIGDPSVWSQLRQRLAETFSPPGADRVASK